MKPTIVFAPASERYVLTDALLVYRTRAGLAHVSHHDVAHNDGGAYIGAGKPLRETDIAGLVAQLAKQQQRTGVSGFVDARLIYFSPMMLAWWRPAAEATVFFNKAPGGKGAKSSGTAPQPGLVFAVTGRRWFVWAVINDTEKPGPYTNLYMPPYFNVYDDGAICTGNIALPKVLTPQAIDGVERAFFDSRFTHANADQICLCDPHALWAELLENKYATFPDEVLLPMACTLEEAIQRITGENHDED